MSMKIIINESSKTNIVNKSKFIGIVKKVMNENEAMEILKNIKKEHPSATHICYAYILPNNEKCSDDGEPLGTAGLPILDILKKNKLGFTIAIVIRYFGGIKLGSNGLIRAYSGIIKELLIDNIKEIEIAYLIEINESYDKSDLINYLLKDDIILEKEYQDKVNIKAIVKKKTLERLSNVSYQIINETII